ncbi:MAG: hypothetical protein QXJ11_05035 [Candidatus Bathyarchaeia archaeon]
MELSAFAAIIVILLFLGFFPQTNFEDVFLQRNNLLPFIDFRSGYPPIARLPYYFLYITFSNSYAYNFILLFFNALTFFLMIFTMYVNVAKLSRERTLSIPLIITLMPSVIYFTLILAHGDTIAITFALLALYFFENPWLAGFFCGCGTLSKFYPVALLPPLIIYYKGLKRKVVLMYSFALTMLLISLPYLIADPLMYISVATSHLLRGPSESIFALIDGYFGHTGFMHPTFDGTLYSWQFATLYAPTYYDHFRYEWKFPILSYISLSLQFASLIGISFLARKAKDKKESLALISLAIFSYLAFSTFYNPLVHIPQICLLAIATMNWNKHKQIMTLIAFEIVNTIHSLVWYCPLFLQIGVMLPLSITIMLRFILYIFVLTASLTRRVKT